MKCTDRCTSRGINSAKSRARRKLKRSLDRSAEDPRSPDAVAKHDATFCVFSFPSGLATPPYEDSPPRMSFPWLENVFNHIEHFSTILLLQWCRIFLMEIPVSEQHIWPRFNLFVFSVLSSKTDYKWPYRYRVRTRMCFNLKLQLRSRKSVRNVNIRDRVCNQLWEKSFRDTRRFSV